MSARSLRDEPRLDFSSSDERTGFRLQRLEVYNWGTFHARVWAVDAQGRNTLLTGDVGSGKSTLVDALTTLLVPPQKLAYNRAAGADARERTARSYVLGHWKAERGDTGAAARPVSLRDSNQYSVVLAVFANEGFSESVTLAQVFWMTSHEGQPDRMYVVADRALSIAEHFAGFGPDVGGLRKRLRAVTKEVFDAFPPYGAAFRRRFGLHDEQALELFHQTVSMKTVGNLTDFVRQHMLEPFPVEERIAAVIHHFDDLVRAHDAVLKAKDQVARLQPLVADCDRLEVLRGGVAELTGCRGALHAFFADAKRALLATRIAKQEEELGRLEARLARAAEERGALQERSEHLKRDVAASGGERLEQIRRDLERLGLERDDRRRRATRYDDLARTLDLASAADPESFVANARAFGPAREAADAALASEENGQSEANVAFHALREQHTALAAELASLRGRRSNVPAGKVALRAQLCRAIGVDEAELPFAGELIQVRDDERAWEGAAERLLRGFGTSLLVPGELYARVAEWVDRTALRDRLVYYRVHHARAPRADVGPDSLARKLIVKPDADHCEWLIAELARRFDFTCCDDLARFRREKQAVTRAGQVKNAGEKHEKDDRFAIDDRSRYVLGWTNDAKIAALEGEVRALEARIARDGQAIAARTERIALLRSRLAGLDALSRFDDFRELDWRTPAQAMAACEDERRRIEAASDQLRALREELERVLGQLQDVESRERELLGERGSMLAKLDGSRAARAECEEVLAGTSDADRARFFPRLEALRTEALEGRALTVESAGAREGELRACVQERLDGEEKKIARLAERIVQAMQAYRTAYPVDAKEADASVAAADEYRRMLRVLVSDDLPAFESRFKQLLNENAIREIAQFSAHLQGERQVTRERIDEINRSLRAIDYNPNRYIRLEASPALDVDVREFQADLRACSEGALTGSEDDAYSEAKFVQVKRIIDRFRGREGMAELDRRWTKKVTDVRNWSVFSASERWREDDAEHEHYSDSAGKSGGQKEKLAYTVLAASLAYKFGLKAGEKRSRSFRFVAIDEAFARGSDDSAAYALKLFQRLNLQLLVVTPLQKIHVIEPYVASVAFVHNRDGRESMIRNLTIDEYRAEREARAG